MFLKQTSISEVSTKIAAAVDESLSKQQKEFFLRQQLAAIQRELQALHRSPSSSSPSSNSAALPTDGNTTSATGTGGTSELDDDEQAEADDLADLRKRIEAMEVGSEERKMGVREWRRLKRIPQGSVENGVIRSYVCLSFLPLNPSELNIFWQLEWLTAVPWPNSTYVPPTSSESSHAPAQSLHARTFLSNARAQLDADHFGLDKIKKRLIEYLAVVRLKEMNAERELAVERQKESEQAAHGEVEEVDGKLDKEEGKKDIDAQTQVQPQQLQFGVPGSTPGKPKHHGRLGKKGVKGPILLSVSLRPDFCITNLPLPSQLRRPPRHWKNFPRAIRCTCAQPTLPAYLPRRRA